MKISVKYASWGVVKDVDAFSPIRDTSSIHWLNAHNKGVNSSLVKSLPNQVTTCEFLVIVLMNVSLVK